MSELGYYDESYPPSLWDPPAPTPPTGVTSGTPGSFTPGGSEVPANITALRALGSLGQTTAWAEGEHVILGNSSHAHWSGSAWTAGDAPAPAPPEEPE